MHWSLEAILALITLVFMFALAIGFWDRLKTGWRKIHRWFRGHGNGAPASQITYLFFHVCLHFDVYGLYH